MFDPSLLQPLPPGVTFRRIDDAVDAARAGARTRNREQVRELLVAELRTRGLMLPPASADSLVDHIVAGFAQRQGGRLAELGKLASVAFRSLTAAIQHQPLPSWNGSAVLLVNSTLPFQPIEVILDRDADEHLAVGDADTIDVWLGLGGPGSPGEQSTSEAIGAADQQVVLFRGDYRVGVLDPDASAAWLPLVRQGRDESRTIATWATRQQARNGEWRLLVGTPHTRSKSR